MLTRIYRDRLFCHIVALFKNLVIYHREAVFDKFGILVRNIKIEFVTARFLLLFHHILGNHVTGSKLLTLRLILMHKTFLVAVEQICALASYRLGYKEALTVFVVGKGCGVELHIA